MTDALFIKRALVSVYDKTGLKELAQFLCTNNIEIISTGGTHRYLLEHGLKATDITEITQFPEILDGRVKTLNPRVFAGLLFDRQREHHKTIIRDLAIAPLDLVVCNLYPFAEVAQNENVTDDELMDNIDIGGSAMLRAAAKNYKNIAVLYNPRAYNDFINHYQAHQGTTLLFRKTCAQQVFAYTSLYDQKIADVFINKLNDESCEKLTINLKTQKHLRYGENPHQKARIYTFIDHKSQVNLANTDPISGKELSYNNLLDAQAAIWSLRCLADHQPEPSYYSVVIKHGVPCGAAFSTKKTTALNNAIASDAKSAFGSIIAFSSEFDQSCVETIYEGFFEIIIASSFTADACAALANKKNLRLLPLKNLMDGQLDKTSFRSILGGCLWQETDTTHIDKNQWTVVTKVKPSSSQLQAMDFAFRLVKATPSNAITLAYPDQLIGVGAGQPNRIQSAELAILGAKARGFDVSKASLASDAFFPFDDCLDLANEHGISSIIQPGGSIRDQEIIEKADRLGIRMVLTHQRHFRH